MTGPARQDLGGGIAVYISADHRFGTDAFLLSAFTGARAGETVCDLCSGCGIVAALWFRGGGGPRAAYCVELLEEAAGLLRRGIGESGLEGRMIPIEGDLRDAAALGLPAGAFDAVSCNPPYKRAGHGIPGGTAARDAARHETFCTIGDVCRSAARLLRYGGRLCLCQRPERLADVMESMRAHGIEPKRLRFVQARAEKAPWLFLLEGRRGGKPFLAVEAPLLTQAAGGGASEGTRPHSAQAKSQRR